MRTLLALLLPWLGGLTLHPAPGPTVHVPLHRDHAATVKLLGPAAGLMSDGSLVADWKRHLAFERPLVWEDADHLVSVLRTRKGWALLRCRVGGDCTRISNLSGDPLSLPGQVVSFL
jgi:hypothetical protein